MLIQGFQTGKDTGYQWDNTTNNGDKKLSTPKTYTTTYVDPKYSDEGIDLVALGTVLQEGASGKYDEIFEKAEKEVIKPYSNKNVEKIEYNDPNFNKLNHRLNAVNFIADNFSKEEALAFNNFLANKNIDLSYRYVFESAIREYNRTGSNLPIKITNDLIDDYEIFAANINKNDLYKVEGSNLIYTKDEFVKASEQNKNNISGTLYKNNSIYSSDLNSKTLDNLNKDKTNYEYQKASLWHQIYTDPRNYAALVHFVSAIDPEPFSSLGLGLVGSGTEAYADFSDYGGLDPTPYFNLGTNLLLDVSSMATAFGGGMPRFAKLAEQSPRLVKTIKTLSKLSKSENKIVKAAKWTGNSVGKLGIAGIHYMNVDTALKEAPLKDIDNWNDDQWRMWLQVATGGVLTTKGALGKLNKSKFRSTIKKMQADNIDLTKENFVKNYKVSLAGKGYDALTPKNFKSNAENVYNQFNINKKGFNRFGQDLELAIKNPKDYNPHIGDYEFKKFHTEGPNRGMYEYVKKGSSEVKYVARDDLQYWDKNLHGTPKPDVIYNGRIPFTFNKRILIPRAVDVPSDVAAKNEEDNRRITEEIIEDDIVVDFYDNDFFKKEPVFKNVLFKYNTGEYGLIKIYDIKKGNYQLTYSNDPNEIKEVVQNLKNNQSNNYYIGEVSNNDLSKVFNNGTYLNELYAKTMGNKIVSQYKKGGEIGYRFIQAGYGGFDYDVEKLYGGHNDTDVIIPYSFEFFNNNKKPLIIGKENKPDYINNNFSQEDYTPNFQKKELTPYDRKSLSRFYLDPSHNTLDFKSIGNDLDLNSFNENKGLGVISGDGTKRHTNEGENISSTTKSNKPLFDIPKNDMFINRVLPWVGANIAQELISNKRDSILEKARDTEYLVTPKLATYKPSFIPAAEGFSYDVKNAFMDNVKRNIKTPKTSDLRLNLAYNKANEDILNKAESDLFTKDYGALKQSEAQVEQRKAQEWAKENQVDNFNLQTLNKSEQINAAAKQQRDSLYLQGKMNLETEKLGNWRDFNSGLYDIVTGKVGGAGSAGTGLYGNDYSKQRKWNKIYSKLDGNQQKEVKDLMSQLESTSNKDEALAINQKLKTLYGIDFLS